MTTKAASGTGNNAGTRRPAVAGSFYPARPERLAAMVSALFATADALEGVASSSAVAPAGLLVPHAGLEYSGVVAAAAWSQLARDAQAGSVVLLGTNHGADWLDGVGVWDIGSWGIPTGDLAVDARLAEAIVALGPPFMVDRRAHAAEHSIEVQLPLLQHWAPGQSIVPLAVSAGRGPTALAAGRALGELLAAERIAGRSVTLIVSSDMAHYPAVPDCARVTQMLVPAITSVDAHDLAERERAVSKSGVPALVCGMCGIEPAVLGLAALRAMGIARGTVLAAATSADMGGPPDRTVGYLAARFDQPLPP